MIGRHDRPASAEIEDRREPRQGLVRGPARPHLRRLEQLEDEAPAELYPGDARPLRAARPGPRETGGGGGHGACCTGRLFEKAGVHTSAVHGELHAGVGRDHARAPTRTRASSPPAISLIAHPRNPRVPGRAHEHPLHRRPPKSWFGGGARPDARCSTTSAARTAADAVALPRRHARRACDAYDPDWHAKYKAWCDEYFFLPHRNEPRGVGGIFYDRHNTGDFERDFAFTRDVGEAFLDVYPQIVRRRMGEPWTRGRARGAAGPPRPLRRVQPALRPRHHVRPEDRRQRRVDPQLHAAAG